MEPTVLIGTYGDVRWKYLAQTRAIPSCGDLPWVHVHADSLHQARNAALEEADTEWVIYLDADDELEAGYVEAMSNGTADVRGPMVRFVRAGRERMWQPRVSGHTHDCTADCLPDGNWLVVGSAVRADLVRAVGGWNDFPWSEDWDLWLRCWKAGATFELVTDAVYRAHVRDDSRNRGATQQAKLDAHRAIYAANFEQAA